MFSQFFILSIRGDILVFRDYRGDIGKHTPELFFQRIVKLKEACEPLFNIDGVNYAYIKESSLYFVMTSYENFSPFLALELISSMTKIVRDYCGILNEEAVRKNFVLIYELLDESLDFGYPQNIATTALKPFVVSTPIIVSSTSSDIISNILHSTRKTTPSSSTTKPVVMDSIAERSSKNEIFVDLIEKITMLFSSNGTILRSEIAGSIVMKSYLKGNPEMSLGLNSELVIGRSAGGYGVVAVDDISFHEMVSLTGWDSDRSISFYPPEGEFVVLQYRISNDFSPPFRVYSFVEDALDKFRLELVIKIVAEIPAENFGNQVTVKIPVPKSCSGVSFESGVSKQDVEYQSNQKIVLWTIKRFQGVSEQNLRIKILFHTAAPPSVKKELGPISMNFEIPMYHCSNINIRFMKVSEAEPGVTPYRWVRYITQSNSYVCRVT